MELQIWSDIACPFCYIGKKNLEEAIKNLPFAEEIKISRHSFQLAPALKTNPNIALREYLAKEKGWTLEYTEQLNRQVSQTAAKAGLDFQLSKVVVANTFKALVLLQLAEAQGKGAQVEERLFKAYFSLGENIDQDSVLQRIAEEAGVNSESLSQALAAGPFVDKAKSDISQAQAYGISAVPCFIINQKYMLSGAQSVAYFQQALSKVHKEMA